MEVVESTGCPRGAAMHTAPKADLTVLPAKGEAFTVCVTLAKKSREDGEG